MVMHGIKVKLPALAMVVVVATFITLSSAQPISSIVEGRDGDKSHTPSHRVATGIYGLDSGLMRGAAWKLKMKARNVGEGLTEGANTGDMGDAGIGGTDHAGPFIVEPIDNDIIQGHPQSRIGKGDSQGVVNAPLQVAHLPKHGFRTGLVIPPFDPNADPDAAPPKSKGELVGGDDTGEVRVKMGAGNGMKAKLLFHGSTLDDTVAGLRLHVGSVGVGKARETEEAHTGGDEKKDPR
ncbi:hypothetical protein CCMSSC00406_0009884 [Pleurotus cornucopiae]|uniref:Uncharacterized protein n=1 Tax=Pleurotus cornucopiae TaxID=5321 RepID=A0ACB7IRE3_PLECO|nr:hypothetical protein CCMSSC00406_0009884 [Pleurotus cornucopiae]